jgi:hypothetical protein
LTRSAALAKVSEVRWPLKWPGIRFKKSSETADFVQHEARPAAAVVVGHPPKQAVGSFAFDFGSK